MIEKQLIAVGPTRQERGGRGREVVEDRVIGAVLRPAQPERPGPTRALRQFVERRLGDVEPDRVERRVKCDDGVGFEMPHQHPALAEGPNGAVTAVQPELGVSHLPQSNMDDVAVLWPDVLGLAVVGSVATQMAECEGWRPAYRGDPGRRRQSKAIADFGGDVL